jgi:antitoxin component YwqK of YwqJK toxin-antitoxin module
MTSDQIEKAQKLARECIRKKYKVNYKNNKQEGAWVGYHTNGRLWRKGNYKNDKIDGAWVYYYYNGQLDAKGNYKNERREGDWVHYNRDGTVDKKNTGTYRNNDKISD